MRIQPFCLGLFQVLVLALLVGGLAPRPAMAQGDLYTVDNSPVDATDEDAASARVAALASGHLQAFEIMIARLVPEEELYGLPPLGAEEIAGLVQDFAIDDERTSTVRYLARLTFRFNPAAVRQFLGQHNVPFAEVRSAPAVVLPVLGSGGGARLWRQPNPWLQAWSSLRLDRELVPLIVPLGDLEDIAAIDGPQSLRGATDRFNIMASRYGVGQVFTAQLVLGKDATTNLSTARVALRRFGGLQATPPVIQSHLQQPDEGQGNFLRRVARAVVLELTEDWKARNLVRLDEQSRLLVTVSVGSLDEWLVVQERLGNVVTVVDSQLAHMTRSSVDVMLTYIGDQEQLVRALAQNDLRLSQDQLQGAWQLSLASGYLPPAQSEGERVTE